MAVDPSEDPAAVPAKYLRHPSRSVNNCTRSVSQKSAESQDIAEIETEMAEKSSPGTRQTDCKNLVWFVEIERKLGSMIYLPFFLTLNYLMVFSKLSFSLNRTGFRRMAGRMTRPAQFRGLLTAVRVSPTVRRARPTDPAQHTDPARHTGPAWPGKPGSDSSHRCPRCRDCRALSARTACNKVDEKLINNVVAKVCYKCLMQKFINNIAAKVYLHCD
jgi:hypothetical protein